MFQVEFVSWIPFVQKKNLSFFTNNKRGVFYYYYYYLERITFYISEILKCWNTNRYKILDSTIHLDVSLNIIVEKTMLKKLFYLGRNILA